VAENQITGNVHGLRYSGVIYLLAFSLFVNLPDASFHILTAMSLVFTKSPGATSETHSSEGIRHAIPDPAEVRAVLFKNFLLSMEIGFYKILLI